MDVFHDTEFEGYRANKKGEILGRTGKLMTLRENSGYLNVQIYHNGKNTGVQVHIIIAKTFLPNPQNYKFVRHKNGNLHDNRVSNLEFDEFLYEKEIGEEFKDITEFEGSYKMSNFGNVVGLVYGNLLALQKEHNYYTVGLKGNGFSKTIFIHQLVAKLFVKNDNKKSNLLVKHLDGDLTNNKFSNLKWVKQFYVPLKDEFFLDIIDYEDNYEISNYGNILLKSTGMLAELDKGGVYHTIQLTKNNVKKHFMVHILVAWHFVLNDDEDINGKVDHIDENKTNNYWLNLRWCTGPDNAKFHHESGNRTYNYKKVIQMDKNEKVIKIWDNLAEIVKENKDYSRKTLLATVALKRKTRRLTYGYYWKYVEKEVHLKDDEIFKNIGMFEENDFSNYECSNYGKIRNIKGHYHALTNSNGYVTVHITSNTDKKNYSLRVHRIVASLFSKNLNKEKLNVVNHLDKNRSNNKPDNLEWTDHQGNTRHAIGKKVQQIDPVTNKVINTFDTITDAYKHFGRTLIGSHISRCCSGKVQTSLGFKWKYC
jgi:hypothetical protein